MIIFKDVKYKNFMSAGDQFITIDLTKNKKTLIIGKNGSGKSTILDALCFSLFGNPYRSVTKNQLTNSINEKDCMVEITFIIGTKNYRVRRGISPNIFEIFVDGTILNQDANVRDYQKKLEDILKMSYKSFVQIVLLGSSSFVPFMQLQRNERREIIENLLDIEIFSVMNGVLKGRLNLNQNETYDITQQIGLKTNSIGMQENLIKKLESSSQTQIDKIISDIDKTEEEIQDSIREKVDLLEMLTEYKELITDDEIVNAKKRKMDSLISGMKNNINKILKEIKFYNDNSNCPTCEQPIDKDFKKLMIEGRSGDIIKVEDGIKKAKASSNELNDKLESILVTKDLIMKHQKLLNTNQANEDSSTKYLAKIKKQLADINQKLSSSSHEVNEAKTELIRFYETLRTLNEDKDELTKSRLTLETASGMLKDSGIKTQIIKQYLPIMNKLINQYLASMDFFVQFELDDQFNETIRSRFRDQFSYSSFSEGEKLRIDLSLLFTWRAVAKLRNSVNVNILCFDEMFDSSLDNAGTDEFMKILSGLSGDTNVFLISHKEDLQDRFDNVLRFEKRNDFSTMNEGE